MASDRQNLQDAFLNHVRKQKISVTVFLINGVKLQGVITWFDNFCILLRRDGQSQLVYKHAISTIMPAQNVSLYEGEEPSVRANPPWKRPCHWPRPFQTLRLWAQHWCRFRSLNQGSCLGRESWKS